MRSVMANEAELQMSTAESVERLIAEQEIRDLLSRYFFALDARDWDGVRACYSEDALEHRSRYEGGVEGFIAYARGVLETYTTTAHHMTTCRVVLDAPGRARAQTYVLAFHRSEGAGAESSDLLVSGYYYDSLQRRDEQWLIVDRYMAYSFAREDAVLGEIPYARPPGAPVPDGFPM